MKSEDEAKILPLPLPWRFSSSPLKGEQLLLLGYGVEKNDNQMLMLNAESECRVFSKTGEARKLEDPDPINPLGYAAWSFAHGCDISHGDSGSPLISIEGGDIVGINWTGKFPKTPTTQSNSGLSALFDAEDESLWSEMNYGVPANKIKELLLRELSEGRISSELVAPITELLSR